MLLDLTLFAIALFAAASLAGAQEYPTRTIKLVVPQGPGSGADVVSRMLADKMSAELKQPVVIDNKPGAQAIIGITAAKQSPADGYTFLLGTIATHAINPVLMAAANSSGGVMGKMIDAQSIVVAGVATGQHGKEGEILRYVFWHSLALACLVGVVVFLQAYVFAVLTCMYLNDAIHPGH